MKLVVGLGNPGFRYRNTRHNIGFILVNFLSKKFRIPVKNVKYKGFLGKGSMEGEKVILFMPQTYMNLSGDAVRNIVKSEKIAQDEFIVVCDDIDLKLGTLRLRKKGLSGGHRGLESIIKCLNTGEFNRLRLGVGREEKPDDVSRFVLDSFAFREKNVLKDVKERASECIISWIKEGPEKAMSLFNS